MEHLTAQEQTSTSFQKQNHCVMHLKAMEVQGCTMPVVRPMRSSCLWRRCLCTSEPGNGSLLLVSVSKTHTFRSSVSLRLISRRQISRDSVAWAMTVCRERPDSAAELSRCSPARALVWPHQHPVHRKLPSRTSVFLTVWLLELDPYVGKQIVVRQEMDAAAADREGQSLLATSNIWRGLTTPSNGTFGSLPSKLHQLSQKQRHFFLRLSQHSCHNLLLSD